MTAKRDPAVRVIAGDLKGRALLYPRDPALRPTMQRTKASVFDSLGDRVQGAVFVDLYAAAGGMGIEALSRGAARAHFVEKDAEATRFLGENLVRCRVDPSRAVVHRADALDFLSGGALRDIAPDLVWADPPYGTRDARLLLEFFAAVRYPLKALLLLEHRRDALPAIAAGRLEVVETRDFGQSRVSWFLLKGDGS